MVCISCNEYRKLTLYFLFHLLPGVGSQAMVCIVLHGAGFIMAGVYCFYYIIFKALPLTRGAGLGGACASIYLSLNPGFIMAGIKAIAAAIATTGPFEKPAA